VRLRSVYEYGVDDSTFNQPRGNSSKEMEEEKSCVGGELTALSPLINYIWILDGRATLEMTWRLFLSQPSAAIPSLVK
jgi:hypothetical protein